MQGQIDNVIPSNNLLFGRTGMTHSQLRLHQEDLVLEARRRKAAARQQERQRRLNESW